MDQQTLASLGSPPTQERASRSRKYLDVISFCIQDRHYALLSQVSSAVENSWIAEDLGRTNAPMNLKPLAVVEGHAQSFDRLRVRIDTVDAHSGSKWMRQLWTGFVFGGYSIDLEIKLLVRLGSCVRAVIVDPSLKNRQGRTRDKAFNCNVLVLKFRRKQ